MSCYLFNLIFFGNIDIIIRGLVIFIIKQLLEVIEIKLMKRNLNFSLTDIQKDIYHGPLHV